MTELRLQFGFTPDGLPARVYRYTTETTFDPTYDTGTGTSYVRVYDLALDEDPLDPDQGTYFTEFPYSLRRLVP